MFLEVALGALIGILVGIITGLLPGLHINAVTVIITSFFLNQTTNNSLFFASLIISIAIAHTIFDYIPTTYLGAPDEENALTVLPAHQLLKEGRGHEAIQILTKGAMTGLIISLIALPLLFDFAKTFDTSIKPVIPFLLIAIVIYIVLREKIIFQGALTWILSGFLGYFALNSPIREPLFPLLTGLFGLSGLAMSMKEKNTIPKQETKIKTSFSFKEITKSSIGGIFIGLPCSILPALGSGYAATINAETINPSRKGFLFSTGIFTMIGLISSFFLVYAIGKARTGASAALKEILTSPSLNDAFYLVGVALFSTIISIFLTLKVSKLASQLITKINYRKLSACIFLLLIAAILFVSGAIGVIIAFTGCAIGLNTIARGTKRIHMMGCLILPTIILYLT